MNPASNVKIETNPRIITGRIVSYYFMMKENTSGETSRPALRKSDLHADPVEQLKRWMDDARKAGIADPSAMMLATATPEGKPSARVVLLKSADSSGIVFFTNYDSRKGKELERNPHAALLFFWEVLGRQVRIEGMTTRTTKEETDAYFRTRPRLSQISAWASKQSEVVAGRDELESAFQRLQKEFEGKEVPAPEWWGGYRLIPSVFEFWQGRENRLHDRLRYRLERQRWILERLFP